MVYHGIFALKKKGRTRELFKLYDCSHVVLNFLLFHQSRKANNVDISGSIILFDEAHNLVRKC